MFNLWSYLSCTSPVHISLPAFHSPPETGPHQYGIENRPDAGCQMYSQTPAVLSPDTIQDPLNLLDRRTDPHK